MKGGAGCVGNRDMSHGSGVERDRGRGGISILHKNNYQLKVISSYSQFLKKSTFDSLVALREERGSVAGHR